MQTPTQQKRQLVWRSYILIIIIASISGSCSFSNTLPRKYVHHIERDLGTVAPLVLADADTNFSTRVDSIRDPQLRKILQELDVDYIEVNYKADTAGKYKLEHDLPNDIFNPVWFLDSSIGFFRQNKTRIFDRSETSYTVTYLFGVHKQVVYNSKDEFHNLIKPLNDSVFIERQHLPKRR